MIDHVVLAKPIVTTGYPPYLHPVLLMPDGMHPLEILVALNVIVVGMVLTLGYYASTPRTAPGTTASRPAWSKATTSQRPPRTT